MQQNDKMDGYTVQELMELPISDTMAVRRRHCEQKRKENYQNYLKICERRRKDGRRN